MNFQEFKEQQKAQKSFPNTLKTSVQDLLVSAVTSLPFFFKDIIQLGKGAVHLAELATKETKYEKKEKSNPDKQ